jgi:putative heme iron utilization protein
LLISQLALHTKNILADARVSLMLDERKEGDPLQGARVMLMGLAAKTESADARRRYLAHQPEAEIFAGFGDFAFYEVKL